MTRVIVALLLMLARPVAASAQDAVTIKNSPLDTSVPESPAFTVLGVTPSTVTRPASPRQLATSLLNGVDQSGNIQTGVALDTAPYMLLSGNGVTLDTYRTNRMVRLLANTQLSFATTKGASEADKSQKVALGFNVAIFDKGDARRDQEYLNQLVAVAKAVLDSLPPAPPGASSAELEARNALVVDRVEAGRKAVREKLGKDYWNRSSWVIAAAPSWVSKDGTASNLESNGGAAWTSLSYGFEGVPGLAGAAQVVLHARYHSRESVADPEKEGAFIEQSSRVFGVSARAGTKNTIGSFETALIQATPAGKETTDHLRLTLVVEERLADNTWLHFSIGGESGQKDGRNKLFILGTFKWAVGPR